MGKFVAQISFYFSQRQKNLYDKQTNTTLLPSEVSDNIEEENDFQIKSGSPKEDDRCPRRIAAQNADLIRNLRNHYW